MGRGDEPLTHARTQPTTPACSQPPHLRDETLGVRLAPPVP